MVHPLLAAPGVEFMGEIGEKEKDALLGNACAFLFPVCWPEPFGLVMIEAMACGTPVLACSAGAVAEVVDPGVTGVIVENPDQAIVAVSQAMALDRHKVRRRFEERFSAQRMARDYVHVYRNLVKTNSRAELGNPSSGDGSVRVTRIDPALTDIEMHAE